MFQMKEMRCEPDEAYFKKFTWMTSSQFDLLTELTRPYTTKKYRGPNHIDAGHRLAIVIRYY